MPERYLAWKVQLLSRLIWIHMSGSSAFPVAAGDKLYHFHGPRVRTHVEWRAIAPKSVSKNGCQNAIWYEKNSCNQEKNWGSTYVLKFTRLAPANFMANIQGWSFLLASSQKSRVSTCFHVERTREPMKMLKFASLSKAKSAGAGYVDSNQPA